jgi:TRAP-type C4-dicarboxylate transport system permease large subunit
MLLRTAGMSSAVMIIIGTASIFSWLVAVQDVPRLIAAWFEANVGAGWTFLLAANILLLIVGMFMETIAALIILFVPLLGLATSVGLDPLHFATFAVLNLMIGLTTPPVGVCLFVACNIARVPLAGVIRAVVPFLISNIIVLLLVSYYPPFATWLPTTLMGTTP